ncbi:hypothetical protein [Streptomyces sp. NPDC005423]|uniref:hypothetical protein n=1 Tax=Streptomyces sp. NPDC005423 TaxID=3155343 RepID=UPI00339FD004
MFKLRSARHTRTFGRLAALTASAGLIAGLGLASAPAASATSYVCYPLSSGVDTSQCTHTSTLHTSSEWSAPKTFNSAFTYLRFQNDGNLVLYCRYGGYSYGLGRTVSAGQAVWASGYSDPTSNHYQRWDFWSDGNMATYSIDVTTGGQSVTWNTQTWHGADTIAIVQTDGNFVLWENGQAVWASNTYHYCPGSQDYWNGYR